MWFYEGRFMARKSKIIVPVFIAALLAGGIYLGSGLVTPVVTMHELLTENKELKQAITTLTEEDQIGYAKVVSQKYEDGRLFTTVKFVETARGDKLTKLIEKQHTVEGDIVHFDALIVTFGDQMVMDGKEKSLYLWRRVYGEKTAPENGMVIEQPDQKPQRYRDLLSMLTEEEQKLFWTGIWELAHDPDRLKEYGIKAVYGNVVYSKLKPGFVYVFKISPSGQLYPQIIPDMWQ